MNEDYFKNLECKSTMEELMQAVAVGFCQLIEEQKRMNRLLACMLRAKTDVSDHWLDKVIKECYGDPDKVFEENVLGIKDDQDDRDS